MSEEYNPRSTSEDIAKNIREGHEQLREARREAQESLIGLALHSVRMRTPGERRADKQIAKGEKMYEKFGAMIEDEADHYVELYQEYAEKLQEIANALGVKIEQRRISDFIDYVGKGEPVRDLINNSNTEGFFVKKAILEDVFTKDVPKGTPIDIGMTQILSERSARTLREEILIHDFDDAYKKAESLGRNYLIRVKSYVSTENKSRGAISSWGDNFKTAYFVPDKEFDEDPEYFPDNSFGSPFAQIKDGNRTTSYTLRYKVEKILLEEVRKQENPISIKIKAAGTETEVISPYLDIVLSYVLSRFGIDSTRFENPWDALKTINDAKIIFPDGREVALVDVTPEMFDDSSRARAS